MSGIPAPLHGRKVLIIVENLPVPFDRRVWLEANALRDAGAGVSIICPRGKGYDARYEEIDGIHIYRHPLGDEGASPLGYLREYATALAWEMVLAWRVFFERGFDAIHACNPPDLIFLAALPFKLLGRKFLFDHHDINPELFEAKFNRKGFFWRVLVLVERLTFALADVSLATNESYRRIAIERGRMKPEDVFIVRSGPDLERVRPVRPDPAWRRGRPYLVGYVGVMGEQEGIDLLLESAADLQARGRQDISYCLIGDGPHLAALRARARELGVDGCVEFPGRLPDVALFEALSTADLCVNPDRVNAMNDQSTMNKIMEYMAMEKPIVQFDVTEGRFSARDASLYARANDPHDMADKIETLLGAPALRRQMGAFGRRRVEEALSWRHQVPRLVDAYVRLFSEKPDAVGHKSARTGDGALL